MAIDPAEFRRVMSRFATGVTVVTAAHGGRLHGITVSAFCSVSLEPPLALICIGRRAPAHDALTGSGRWAINMLPERGRELSSHFAREWGPDDEPFAGVPYRLGVTGEPLLDGCIAWAACRLEQTLDGGDHTIFVGRVVDGAVASNDGPLLYFLSGYRSLKGGADARGHLRPG